MSSKSRKSNVKRNNTKSKTREKNEDFIGEQANKELKDNIEKNACDLDNSSKLKENKRNLLKNYVGKIQKIMGLNNWTYVNTLDTKS